VSAIELFDELEEWHLMQAHYCVVLASQKSPNTAGADVWASVNFAALQEKRSAGPNPGPVTHDRRNLDAPPSNNL
jgi:hypothetical protein